METTAPVGQVKLPAFQAIRPASLIAPAPARRQAKATAAPSPSPAEAGRQGWLSGRQSGDRLGFMYGA
jgi:hypothetical protein